MPQYQGVSHLSNLSPLYDHTGKLFNTDSSIIPVGGGGGTLGTFGWGCAAGTLEPLSYTRASSAEFCYPILE